MPETPLIDIHPDHWAIVQAILQKHVPQHEVWAFGSRAKWLAKEYSDLDLAIITDKALPLDVYASLSDDFSESDLPYRVDVVDWATTGESFRKIIQRDKVVVQHGKKSLGAGGETRSLAELCSLIADCPHSTPVWTESGVIVLRSQNIRNGRLDLTKPSFTDVQHYRERIRRAEPLPGDIVITREAPMGEVCMIPDGLKCCLGQRMVLLRPDSSKAIGRYLLYALQSCPVRHQIFWAEGTGSTVSNLRIPDLKALRIPVYALNEQRAIAHILGTLDDKIELNRRQNETLEAMARALFKAWFVDFEPVRAKMEGRWQRGQSLPGLPAHLYDLFPGRLVESELGEIPEGWEVANLADCFDFKEGPGIRSWQYTNTNEGIRFINIRCIRDGDLYLDTANRITEEEANGKYAHFQLQPWDIVVSTSGTLGRSAIVRAEHLPLVLNTSVIRFRPIGGRTTFSLTYQYLNSLEFLQKLKSMASGSVQKNFGPVHLKQIKILLASFKVIQFYETFCRPLYERIINGRSQATTFSYLRDTLLPKLISGQLRVKDAEAFLKERGL